LPPGLTIFNEADWNVTENSVTITWQTNYFATSRVIYATTSGLFDLSDGEPYYGYTDLKEGDDTGLEKVTAHSVTITGLSSGTIYYYRCVSHASLAISEDHSFTTLGVKEEEAGEEEEEKPKEELPTPTPPSEEGEGISGEEVIPGEEGEVEGVGEEVEEEKPIVEAKKEEGLDLTKFLAGIGNFTLENSCWILTLIMTILASLLFLSKKRKREILEKKKYYWISVLAIVILIVLAILLKCWLLIIPIIILLIFLLSELLKSEK